MSQSPPTSPPVAPPPGPPAWPPPAPSRRAGLPRWVWVSGAVLVACFVLGNVIRLPYVIFSPGSATPVDGVVEIEGAPTYDHDGQVLFLTVSVSSDRPSLWRYLAAELDGDSRIVHEDDYLGGQSRGQSRRANVQLMDESQLIAKKVALEALGYEVTVTGRGARIAEVVPGSPAAGELEVGDLVTAIDGTPITLADQLGTIVRSQPVGTTFTFTVSRDGEVSDVEVTTAEGTRGDLRGRPYVGVSPVTEDLQFEFPVDVTIDAGEVSGPSAGLAFTLTIIDLMTPGDLTGGEDVAVTGTIGFDGSVGEVGGVPQKTVAARDAGAELLLVPASEVGQAREQAGDGLEVVGVEDIDDALTALRRNGGAPVERVGLAA